MFTSYCNTLHNIEVQLLNMFGDADGKTDLLLKYLSKAVSGAYYYAPSVERLQNLYRLKGRLKKNLPFQRQVFVI